MTPYRNSLSGKPVPSFEAKLSALISETSMDGWDGEGSSAIPTTRWDNIRTLVTWVRGQLPKAGEPHPSAGSDGSRHLRWAQGDRLFDIDFAEDGRVYWARRIGTTVTSGSTGSPTELRERLEETFA